MLSGCLFDTLATSTIFMYDFACRRHNCVVSVFLYGIFRVSSFVFTSSVRFHENNIARFEYFMYSFFIMKVQRFFLISLNVVFYFIEVNTRVVKKYFAWSELCNRVYGTIVLSYGIENLVDRFARFCFAREFAISKIVE